MEKDNVVVVDHANQQHTYPYFLIDQKINDIGTAFKNKFNQHITLDCMVQITEGQFKGKTGVVKHIYNDSIFLYNTEFVGSSGIFVESANNCYLTSSNLNSKRQRTTNYRQPLAKQ